MEGESGFGGGGGAASAGDVGPSGVVEGSAGQIAQGAHDGGGALAADLAGVLGKGDVFGPADSVFDDPVSAGPR